MRKPPSFPSSPGRPLSFKERLLIPVCWPLYGRTGTRYRVPISEIDQFIIPDNPDNP